MTRREQYGLGLAALVASCFLVSVYLEQKPTPTVQQAVAHERTQVATVAAAKADTVRIAAALDAATARALYRSVRDSALRSLQDTMLVKRALAKADTAFVHDTVALARADTVIVREKAIVAVQGTELALATQPHPPPRLRTTIAALYDPVAARYSGSGEASFRVIGGWALLVRADAPLGERPQMRIGVALTL